MDSRDEVLGVMTRAGEPHLGLSYVPWDVTRRPDIIGVRTAMTAALSALKSAGYRVVRVPGEEEVAACLRAAGGLHNPSDARTIARAVLSLIFGPAAPAPDSTSQEVEHG